MSIVAVAARHPRYTLSVALGLLITCLVLATGSDDASVGQASLSAETFSLSSYNTPILNVGAKLENAEAIYQRMVNSREGLIKKFGPRRHNIKSFPPNVSPWPPYTLWDFIPAAFQCPWEVERLGNLGDGGKWTCGISRLVEKKNCVVYSMGVNRESSFEAAVLDRTMDCDVYGFDFSVTSFAEDITKSSKRRARSHFYPYKIGETDAPTESPPQWTLPSIMRANGHTFIDVLKIDIESWEFVTLTQVIKQFTDLQNVGDDKSKLVLPFGQLQLEIHAWPERSFEYYLGWWEMLEAAGLRPFWTEPNGVYSNYNRGGSPDLAEYSFINIRGSHELLNDTPVHNAGGAKAPRQ